MDPAIERQLKKSKAKYRFESQNEIFNVSSRSIELAQQLAIEGEKRRRAEARPPRQGGIIKVNRIIWEPKKYFFLLLIFQVSFNKREFSHPARESKREEEEEWLRKQVWRHSLLGWDLSVLCPPGPGQGLQEEAGGGGGARLRGSGQEDRGLFQGRRP